ncbi:MAG: TIGR01777 family oxidoreductase [Bacillota bacterium]|nr:TIGR01777 family oxidoreductase [Bacillota bacterium]
MRVVVTGGTGLIGRALAEALASEGHGVVVLSRRPAPSAAGRLPPGVRLLAWPALPAGELALAPGPQAGESGEWRRALEEADAVVHLAGESIASGRWTAARKERILQSRVRSTRALVEALEAAERRPKALVSGSAVGYYGPHGDEELTEEAGPGSDFLARVCVAWEREAEAAERLGLRVVRLRTGLVLAREGGALPQLLRPFRLGLGGPLGGGGQWVPWIHLADEVGLIRWALEEERVEGPLNAVAPEPVRQRELARLIGRFLGRPAWFPAPAPLLRLALGEMAEALLLSGQRALPARALALGYRFRYARPEAALEELLGPRGGGGGRSAGDRHARTP